MMSTGVYVLLGVGGLALIFSILSSSHGPRTAFLASCWLPLAGLAMAFLNRNQMGYAALAVLAVIFVASVGLVGMGIGLCAKAHREKTGIGALIAGTVVAGAPWLILLALWLMPH